MSILGDFSALLRTRICLVSALLVIIAGYLTDRLNVIASSSLRTQTFLDFLFSNPILPFEGIVLGMIIPFSLVAGTYVMNDYFDYQSDLENGRVDRPLVRGEIRMWEAKWLSIILFSCSILISLIMVIIYQLSPLIPLLAVLFIGIGIIYNLGVKKFGIIGHLLISLALVAPISLGVIIVEPISEWVLLNMIILSLFLLFVALGRETIKDILDVKGNHKAGKRSFAILLGLNWAARISGIIFVFGIIIGSLLLFLGFSNNLIYLGGFVAVSALLLWTATMIIRNPDPETATKARIYSRWALWLYILVIFISSFFIIL